MLRLPEENPKKNRRKPCGAFLGAASLSISHLALKIFTPATGHLV
jgi:hypothetical protein